MSDRDFLRFSDRDILKVLRELDIEDVAWFLLDADDDVKEHIMRNFSKRELESYQHASGLLNRDNAERLDEGRQRVLRVLRGLAERSDIIPKKEPV